jgi:hypothetical protein
VYVSYLSKLPCLGKDITAKKRSNNNKKGLKGEGKSQQQDLDSKKKFTIKKMIGITRDQHQTRVRRIVVGSKMGRNERQVMRRSEEAKIAGGQDSSSTQLSPEPVFLNVYGAPESIPRNEFRQPM